MKNDSQNPSWDSYLWTWLKRKEPNQIEICEVFGSMINLKERYNDKDKYLKKKKRKEGNKRRTRLLLSLI